MEKKNMAALKRFMMINRQMRKLNVDTTLQEFDLKPNEFAVLHMLERYQEQGEAEMKISDVAKHLRNASSTISPIIQSLVEKGYITRTTSSEDRRVSIIMLTIEGKNYLKIILNQLEGKFEEVLTVFGEQKTEELMNLLEELSQIITKVGEGRGVII